MPDRYGVAIIGCGLIGQKRALSLRSCRLVGCCDVVPERAEQLARKFRGAETWSDWRVAANHNEVDIVVVATTHDHLACIAETAAAAGKHVLIEKPGARRASELDGVLLESQRTGSLVRVGFNHRYHHSLQQAFKIAASGMLGELMYVRGRYGHGGRPGYDQEWRARPQISGGGELLDQGVHLIDLARWFLGDFSDVSGHIATYFWNMPVEDNAFLLLKTAAGKTAFLHTSWTEWKNMFSVEICGRTGKLEATGLGGSYGIEKLAFYRMLPCMGPPETTIWEYPMADNSWELEFDEFLEDIRLDRDPIPGIRETQAVLRVVEKVYGDSTP
jgi:predicted dehydrogenase